MTESEQRRRLRAVIFAGGVVSVLLTVWVIYAARTGQYRVLAQYPLLLLLGGGLLISMGAFLGGKAVREESWPGHTRLLLGVRALSSLLFGLAILWDLFGGARHVEFTLVSAAVALWPVGWAISLFAVSRSWQQRTRGPST